MRLDVYLKLSRLVPRRNLAQELIGAGRISLNDQPAKSGKTVKPEDLIEIRRLDRITRVRILLVPAKKQVSKKDAPALYEIISEKVIEKEWP